MRLPVIAAIVSLLTCGPVAVADTTVYYTNYKYVISQDIPGGPPQTIFEGTYDGRPMYIESYGSRLYWTSYSTGELWVSSFDGTDARVLYNTPGSYPRGIDFHAGRIYWAHEGLGKIFSGDLGGQGFHEVYSGPSGYNEGPDDIDVYDGRIYWTSWHSTSVMTCALDGTDYQTIPLASPGRAFAIQVTDDAMYVAVNSLPGSIGAIRRYTMDGTSFDVLADGYYILDMQLYGDRVYFNCEQSSAIYSVPLAGGVPRLEADVHSWQLTVVPEPATVSLLAAGLLALLSRSSRRRRHGNTPCRDKM